MANEIKQTSPRFKHLHKQNLKIIQKSKFAVNPKRYEIKEEK
jgi:hypothetical protein